MPSAKTTILTAFLLVCLTAQAPHADAQTTSPDGTRRLRIGLVLSGGGARGAAHIGVLKMLDQLHVPVDAIAGTSMGAVVGGLYASGLSGQQIEQAMASVNWQTAFRDYPPRNELDYRRKQESERYLVNLPLGLQGRKLVIPRGLIQSQKLTETLRQLTLPVATVSDFDHLPTPFRAIATNLETGAAVVLGEGDLATAMRASMAVPGVFAPVEYRGQVLVDGGLADYLPIDVAHAMHVDVLIVVDSGYTLQPRKNLVSLPSITQQMVSILLRKNIEQQLSALSSHDLVISPELGNFSSYDFVDTLKIVNAGVSATQKMAERLRAFALPEAQYAEYLARRAAAAPTQLPRIQFVQSAPESTAFRRQIEAHFDRFVGQRLDPSAVQEQQELLYGHGFLELLDYRLQQDAAGQYGLDVTALRNSWGPNYLRVGVQLQDDFKGNTVFNAAGRVDFTELNSLGAESVWDAQVGTSPLLATEFFQPLSIMTQYFVAPMLQVEAHDIPQVENSQQVGKYREHSFEYGLSVGREFGNWGEIRIGAQNVIGDIYVSQGFSAPSTSFNVTQYFARFGFDTLDNANFPRAGQALTTQITVESNSDGQEGSDLFAVDWRVAHSWAKNTLGLWLTAGSTVGGSTTTVRNYFPLGGFLNLSGVETNTLAGPQMAIGRLIYFRKIGNGGEGILDVPAYLGASFEMGNVWSQRSQVTFGSARKDGSVFFGADTYIGPAYLAAGYDQSGSVALYVFVGRAF